MLTRQRQLGSQKRHRKTLFALSPLFSFVFFFNTEITGDSLQPKENEDDWKQLAHYTFSGRKLR